MLAQARGTDTEKKESQQTARPGTHVAEAGQPEPAQVNSDFGPLIVVEKIEISGNESTERSVILAAMSVHEGDALRAGSEKLKYTKLRILALGYFREVSLSLAKGSQPGHVVLVIHVVERGTIALNRIYFGNSKYSPWWLGIDLTERNILGTGLALGGAVVTAASADVPGAESQFSAAVHLSDPALLSTRLGWQASGYSILASEPFRVSGEPDDQSANNFQAFSYQRAGARVGVLRRLRPFTLSLGGRAELIDSELPANPPLDLNLRNEQSSLVSAGISVERDTRNDPIMPWHGHHLWLHTDLGSSVIGSDYGYVSILAKAETWRAVHGNNHVISLHLSGGAVLGDAPQFERIHVGDLSRMVPPRSLGLVTSTAPSLNLVGDTPDSLLYGDLGGTAEVQYSRLLFRRNHIIYGGSIFFGTGLWALASLESGARDAAVDLLIDAGLRLDTEVGIFEFSITNGLGRLPL